MIANEELEERPHGQPTVLDWFRSLLRLRPIPIPEAGSIGAPAGAASYTLLTPKPAVGREAARFDLRGLLLRLRFPAALLLAFVAQIGLERRWERGPGLSIALYLMAAGVLIWSLWGDELLASPAITKREQAVFPLRVPYLIGGLVLAGLTYLTSADNTFRLPTVVFWIGSVVAIALAFWDRELQPSGWLNRLKLRLSPRRLKIEFDPWMLLVLGAFLLSAYFRLGKLAEVPYEMWSDHAEKILDVVDVLNGQTLIFFPRNTGREPLQLYLIAAAVKWFGAGLSYLTMKTISAVAGLLALPYIYLLGREVGGRRVGLVAMLLAGVAYWPNVVGRIGLRHVFYMFFVAPGMYYLVRGLLRGRRNDLLLSGLAIGAGLYGYTASRITPLLAPLGFALYLLHGQSRSHRKWALAGFAMLVLVALAVSVPLLRVAYEEQDMLLERSLARLTSNEQALPGPPLQLFLSNLWRALRMFAWDNGEIWVVSVPFRPALDWVTGALFHLGIVITLVRYIRRRHWVDLFLVLSIPVLLMPSVLSLAFPAENPHPSRTSGAIVPVFIIAALPLAALPAWAQDHLRLRRSGAVAAVAAILIFLVAASINHRLTFKEYGVLERNGTWNTTEAAAVVRGFVDSIGDFEHVHILAYPHWMDTRLVAIIAGRPGADPVLWPDQLEALAPTTRPQLFLLHPEDAENLSRLRQTYPTGTLSSYNSPMEGRDFRIYFVPAAADEAVLVDPEIGETP